jgi:hypothetical protein
VSGCNSSIQSTWHEESDEESKMNEEEATKKKNKESNFMSKHLIKGLKRDLCS